MSTKDFIRKWGTNVKGDWWLRDAECCYWAASFRMFPDELVVMSRDFLELFNFDVYRGTEASSRAYELVKKAYPHYVMQ